MGGIKSVPSKHPLVPPNHLHFIKKKHMFFIIKGPVPPQTIRLFIALYLNAGASPPGERERERERGLEGEGESLI